MQRRNKNAKVIPEATLDQKLQTCIEKEMVNLVEKLLDQGANPNGTQNFSPLYRCIVSNTAHSNKIVEILINRGADINLKYQENTPLLVAIRSKNSTAFNLLIQKANIDIFAAFYDSQGFAWTPLKLCLIRNLQNTAFAQALIKKMCENISTPLSSHVVESVALLIQEKQIPLAIWILNKIAKSKNYNVEFEKKQQTESYVNLQKIFSLLIEMPLDKKLFSAYLAATGLTVNDSINIKRNSLEKHSLLYWACTSIYDEERGIEWIDYLLKQFNYPNLKSISDLPFFQMLGLLNKIEYLKFILQALPFKLTLEEAKEIHLTGQLFNNKEILKLTKSLWNLESQTYSSGDLIPSDVLLYISDDDIKEVVKFSAKTNHKYIINILQIALKLNSFNIIFGLLKRGLYDPFNLKMPFYENFSTFTTLVICLNKNKETNNTNIFNKLNVLIGKITTYYQFKDAKAFLAGIDICLNEVKANGKFDASIEILNQIRSYFIAQLAATKNVTNDDVACNSQTVLSGRTYTLAVHGPEYLDNSNNTTTTTNTITTTMLPTTVTWFGNKVLDSNNIVVFVKPMDMQQQFLIFLPQVTGEHIELFKDKNRDQIKNLDLGYVKYKIDNVEYDFIVAEIKHKKTPDRLLVAKKFSDQGKAAGALFFAFAYCKDGLHTTSNKEKAAKLIKKMNKNPEALDCYLKPSP